MEVSKLKRKDIDSCAFLIKMLRSARYDVEGSAVADMYHCNEWVQSLSVAVANGWNKENVPKEPPKGADGPRNVKVTNPVGSI